MTIKMECTVRIPPTKFLSVWMLFLGTLNIAGLRYGPVSIIMAEPLDSVKVSVVAGSEAVLPCDTRTPEPPDALLLVVWYKDDVPIYSYDGRAKGPSAHWADEHLQGRARWHPELPSALHVVNVVPTDRAVYRCRVDFKVTPTRNLKILLDVIELPEKPKIFDERDKEIVGVAGPYYEETSLRLSCVVSGGKPMPRVRWWRDDKVIATLPPIDDDTRLSVLELRVPKLTRDYLETVYTCTADNTALVPPLRVNVQIQLYLRPLSVEILSREQPLSVGQNAELSCRAIGARPPAVITWWLDGKQLVAAKPQKNSADNNETLSVLRWTPRMEHDKRMLVCRASHVILEHSTIEATMVLNLHYVPIVNLQLGSKMNPNDIEEGDDVYFDCVVRANPPAYKVVWEHNGQAMTHNQRAGVIAGSAHLALQSVSRAQAGKYACTASNVEGDGRSQAVHLQVIYKPVCKMNQLTIVGAALNESVKVICEVDAYPPPEKVQWTLNNSMGTVELDPANFTIDSVGRSILTYTPRVDSEYGSLACRAANLAGQQVVPCRYTVLPAVRPDAPYNCSAVNLTDDSVELRCFAGYDGGLRTMFVVEAWAAGALIANVSATQPLWRLKSLGAGRALKMVFYAHNARGRSEVATLRIHTLSRLALHTALPGVALNIGCDTPEQRRFPLCCAGNRKCYTKIDTVEAQYAVSWETGWALAVTSGIAAVLCTVVCFGFLLRKRRHRASQYQAPMQNAKGSKGSIHNSCHSPLQADDKNPDVVPLGKDFHCTREVEPPPAPPPYGSVVSPPVASRSVSSFNDIITVRASTPHTPGSEVQSIGTLAEDRRSVTSGTLSRRREVVTTRTPLLAANARESCV